jgi:anti-sigma factor RsiW
MTQCYRFERLLTAYADGELTGRRARAVERHLAGCPACARALDSLRASDRLLRGAGVPAVSPERWDAFRRDLTAALNEADRDARRSARVREARPVEPQARRWVPAVAVACAAALVAVAGVRSADLGRLLPWVPGNECIVDSIESYAEGATPMFFTSEDPEMTVIWVFSDENGGGGPRP